MFLQEMDRKTYAYLYTKTLKKTKKETHRGNHRNHSIRKLHTRNVRKTHCVYSVLKDSRTWRMNINRILHRFRPSNFLTRCMPEAGVGHRLAKMAVHAKLKSVRVKIKACSNLRELPRKLKVPMSI